MYFCTLYGMVNHMGAKLLLKEKFVFDDGAIFEAVIWQLPCEDKERPHYLKYRLFYGYPGCCLVRYDNEKGKGDHRHYQEKEQRYNFVSIEKLINDFKADIKKLRDILHE